MTKIAGRGDNRLNIEFADRKHGSKERLRKGAVGNGIGWTMESEEWKLEE